MEIFSRVDNNHFSARMVSAHGWSLEVAQIETQPDFVAINLVCPAGSHTIVNCYSVEKSYFKNKILAEVFRQEDSLACGWVVYIRDRENFNLPKSVSATLWQLFWTNVSEMLREFDDTQTRIKAAEESISDVD